MVNYMCTMPPNVQRMISEALSIISKHDFPAKVGKHGGGGMRTVYTRRDP